jgi:gamma-glutamylcyclotransferase (GGCT)/AIG2-like uncharacterized protein YtfP
MTDQLFVYGSLLSGSGHPNAVRLGREAAAIEPATIAGRLYRVDWYPGLVAAAGPTDVVHGELVTLRAPALSLPWLDAYEGLDRSDEYGRRRADVITTDGRRVPAWVYVYQRPVDGLTRVPGGRWL